MILTLNGFLNYNLFCEYNLYFKYANNIILLQLNYRYFAIKPVYFAIKTGLFCH